MAIVNKAHQANQTYPFAVSLIESVRAYERTLEKVKTLLAYDLLFRILIACGKAYFFCRFVMSRCVNVWLFIFFQKKIASNEKNCLFSFVASFKNIYFAYGYYRMICHPFFTKALGLSDSQLSSMYQNSKTPIL